MRSLIEQKVTIPISFRARSCEHITLTQTQNYTWRLSVTGGVEKPRYIVLAFQTDKSDDQKHNPAVFDNLQLINAYVTLNSERFPTSDIITNFYTNDYVKLYDMFDNFKKDYYGIDLVFDVRKRNEKLRTGVTDIQVKLFFGANVPANTNAYEWIISDRFFKMSSDGKKYESDIGLMRNKIKYIYLCIV